MSNPTAGYKSRADAVRALRKQGFSQELISRMLQIRLSEVKVALRYERRGVRSVMSAQVRTALSAAAAARGTDAHGLASLLLTNIVRDKLIDAVLDDGSEVADAR
jgi:hypothetical protein